VTTTPHFTLLGPDDTAALLPAWAPAGTRVWVYRYRHPAAGWTLSIATCAEPGSGKLSLGGFRIAPQALTSEPGFDVDRMAVGLAAGMEEKVYWSRLIRVGGPLALAHEGGIVGGKCVMHPTDDARVGAPRDREMLDFALACFRDAEERGGFHITTGQDLGHGTLSDGSTQSLDYLASRFHGCVDADTSKPTGEGNYYVLKGMLDGLDVALPGARVGLVGVGNIGLHILHRLRAHGTTVHALEAREERRQEVAAMGIEVFAPDEKARLLALPLDALVVNANKESLDSATVDRIIANPRLRVICGSENLAMPAAKDADRLRDARRVYAPTELGGMMGYLTAVEEYLAHQQGVPFDVATLFEAAKRLEVAGRDATRHVVERDFAIGFEDAVREVFGGAAVG
jgi:hypothetical protein